MSDIFERAIPIIVFDVNETLLDITVLEPLFVRVFGDGLVMREWFAQLILYSQTMTLSGLYTPFGELAVGTLQMLGSTHDVDINNSDIDELKKYLNTMPAHADVVPALSRLRDAGYRLVTLTNSTHASSVTVLEHAGLGEFFERCFSVDEVKKFKPAAETYHCVAKTMGVDASELLMVACHLWDTIGAQAAGCRGALIIRPYNAFLPAENVPVPDISAANLRDFAEQLISAD